MMYRTKKYKKQIRGYITRGDSVAIPLNNGEFAIIDKADMEIVNKYHWFSYNAKCTFYANTHEIVNGKRSVLSMHCLLMGKPDGKMVDHIDGNGLNNRRSNLRYVTNGQNKMNSRPARNGKVGFKGVFKVWTGKYTSQICVNGQQIHLGTFIDSVDAAKAYDKAAIEYHGEFALTNKKLKLY